MKRQSKTSRERRYAGRRTRRSGPRPAYPAPPFALPADEISPRLCRKCGLEGLHLHANECIAALRDRLGVLELQRGTS